MLCVVRYNSLQRADFSSRGFQVRCVCTWSRNINNEAALAPVGAGVPPPPTKKTSTHYTHTHTHTHTHALVWVSLNCNRNWRIFSRFRYLVSFASFQNIKYLRTCSAVFRWTSNIPQRYPVCETVYSCGLRTGPGLLNTPCDVNTVHTLHSVATWTVSPWLALLLFSL